ncbi:MAG: glutathione S-transferase N-terminal domain-containing protein [Neomegalonema sp.]|nr:glutathione S-transferase N-terminal domain-containing protein [Neomegalonema sp.]
MYQLYTWSTPNGRKASIMLEELGVEFEVKPVDLSANESSSTAFLAVNPHGKIPALVDTEAGRTIVESGAIMLYLGEKHGRFLGDEAQRWETVQWVMWQMSALGPVLGQTHHFYFYNKGKAPYAEERFRTAARGLYGVLDKRLEARDYIVDAYGVADMICFPWIARWPRQGIELTDYPNVLAWYRQLAERPAVQRGYAIPVSDEIPMPS